jgi:hypothetical protein
VLSELRDLHRSVCCFDLHRLASSVPNIYRIRAAAGIIYIEPERQLEQEALAAWAQARPRTSGSRLALYRRTSKYRRAARPGCNGAQWSPGVRQQQPRALLEDTGLQSRPTTDGSTETPTTNAHVCANGPISHLCPGPVQPPQSFNYELDRPGCDTRAPCGVICLLQPAWIK